MLENPYKTRAQIIIVQISIMPQMLSTELNLSYNLDRYDLLY